MQTPIFTASHGAMPFRRQKPPAAQGGTRLDLTRLDLEDRTRRRLPSHPPTSAVRPCHPGDTLDPSNWIDPADGKARPRMNLFLKSPARSPARYTGTPSSRDPRRIPMASAGYVRHFASDEFEDEPQSNEKHERKDKQKEELPRHPPTSAVRPCHPWDTLDPSNWIDPADGKAGPRMNLFLKSPCPIARPFHRYAIVARSAENPDDQRRVCAPLRVGRVRGRTAVQREAREERQAERGAPSPSANIRGSALPSVGYF